MTTVYEHDAETFAGVLGAAELPDLQLSFGHFLLKGRRGVADRIQYNEAGLDLLGNRHEYTFPIRDGDLQVSLQLYMNVLDHHRLFCYTRMGQVQGMTFSINLTTERESDRIIYLTQKLKFAERYDGDEEIARAHRRQKQTLLAGLLRGLDVEVSENNDVLLGIFDPQAASFASTTPEQFLNDFLVVSLLKGHFQGNKGYRLEVLPSFTVFETETAATPNLESAPRRVVAARGNRVIPLSLRYEILSRDGFRCRACGRTPSADGVKLHIDHIRPFSLGGLTEKANLRTLCNDCNIGRSNRYTD
ncbi:MAG: HNH endonuclease signature motif containing protein [Minicystis sp.]